MAKTHTILEVFIASPGDVAQERAVLEEVVYEFNLTWGNKHKVRLELVKWETHSRPSLGADAQDVINKQVGDSYDIFLGIMWGRFGTTTARAESGTEEEFARAYERLQGGDNVQIMFYFKDAGISPSRMDSEQIVKVQAFKKRISDVYGGLYHLFETTEEFQTKARIHLSTVVQDWLSSNNGVIESKSAPIIDAPKADAYNPLANLVALDDSETDDGIFDLIDRGNEAMDELVQIVNRMGVATKDLGQKFDQRTEEVNAISSGGAKVNIKSAKRVVNNSANDLDVFVKRISVEVLEFYKQNAIFSESFGKVAMLYAHDFKEENEFVKTALSNIQEYRSSNDSLSVSLEEFRESISKLPRVTSTFNQARRRAVAIMSDLLAQLRIASSQSTDIENLLLRLLKTDAG